MPTRPCWVEICTRTLEENYRFLSATAGPGVDLLAVVKSDAYGHSLRLCAPAAVRAGAPWIGVTSVEEGIEAHHVCPDTRILIMSGAFPGQAVHVIHHKLTPVVWDHWQFDELEAEARAHDVRSLSVHLEIDTGMSRQGVAPESLGPILDRFHRDSPLRLEALMTHLFAADEADESVTTDQLARMNDALDRIQAAGLHAGILNIGNSAALLAGATERLAALAARYDMNLLIRPGLALYGIAPEFDPAFDSVEPICLGQARRRLHPVLSWKSRVVSVRSIQPGTVIGYNGTFVATEPMRVALIPTGYADGLDRKLGNHFSVLVRGQRAPLVGRISMDQSVMDVTEIPGVEPGDEVVLLGQQGGETITAFDHARATNTIPWEVFTRIGARVPRIEY
ncbi:MAG TPA: alanine racemase [Terracidiphilus sp.]|jgi:alanine racemase